MTFDGEPVPFTVAAINFMIYVRAALPTREGEMRLQLEKGAFTYEADTTPSYTFESESFSTTFMVYIQPRLTMTFDVAKLLQTLEEKGAVQRACDPADRRRVQVCLTPCGQEMVHTAHGHMVRQLTRLFDALGELDAREYVRLCGRVAELVRQLRAAPPEENEVSK